MIELMQIHKIMLPWNFSNTQKFVSFISDFFLILKQLQFSELTFSQQLLPHKKLIKTFLPFRQTFNPWNNTSSFIFHDKLLQVSEKTNFMNDIKIMCIYAETFDIERRVGKNKHRYCLNIWRASLPVHCHNQCQKINYHTAINTIMKFTVNDSHM